MLNCGIICTIHSISNPILCLAYATPLSTDRKAPDAGGVDGTTLTAHQISEKGTDTMTPAVDSLALEGVSEHEISNTLSRIDYYGCNFRP